MKEAHIAIGIIREGNISCKDIATCWVGTRVIWPEGLNNSTKTLDGTKDNTRKTRYTYLPYLPYNYKSHNKNIQ